MKKKQEIFQIQKKKNLNHIEWVNWNYRIISGYPEIWHLCKTVSLNINAKELYNFLA